jgi:hypothetical protein
MSLIRNNHDNYFLITRSLFTSNLNKVFLILRNNLLNSSLLKIEVVGIRTLIIPIKSRELYRLSYNPLICYLYKIINIFLRINTTRPNIYFIFSDDFMFMIIFLKSFGYFHKYK